MTTITNAEVDNFIATIEAFSKTSPTLNSIHTQIGKDTYISHKNFKLNENSLQNTELYNYFEVDSLPTKNLEIYNNIFTSYITTFNTCKKDLDTYYTTTLTRQEQNSIKTNVNILKKKLNTEININEILLKKDHFIKVYIISYILHNFLHNIEDKNHLFKDFDNINNIDTVFNHSIISLYFKTNNYTFSQKVLHHKDEKTTRVTEGGSFNIYHGGNSQEIIKTLILIDNYIDNIDNLQKLKNILNNDIYSYLKLENPLKYLMNELDLKNNILFNEDSNINDYKINIIYYVTYLKIYFSVNKNLDIVPYLDIIYDIIFLENERIDFETVLKNINKIYNIFDIMGKVEHEIFINILHNYSLLIKNLNFITKDNSTFLFLYPSYFMTTIKDKNYNDEIKALLYLNNIEEFSSDNIKLSQGFISKIESHLEKYKDDNKTARFNILKQKNEEKENKILEQIKSLLSEENCVSILEKINLE